MILFDINFFSPCPCPASGGPSASGEGGDLSYVCFSVNLLITSLRSGFLLFLIISDNISVIMLYSLIGVGVITAIILFLNTIDKILKTKRAGNIVLAGIGVTDFTLNLIDRFKEYQKNNESGSPEPEGGSLYKVVESIINKFINLYSKFYLYCQTNLKKNYIIPFIFKSLGSDIPKDAEPIITLSFNILILSLIILGCFINITGYFISIYLINKYNIEERFPKYSKLIKYYENSNIFFVIIEIFICLICLIILIAVNLSILGIYL